MLQKQNQNISFGQGLDTKTDPFQVKAGKLLALTNSVFTTGDRLQKRNGFPQLADLPNKTSSYLTTLNQDLVAVGPSISGYSSGNNTWYPKGSFQPISLSTLPIVKNSINQTQCDSVIAANGLICEVYTETQNGVSAYKYAIVDSANGQNIVAPTLISVPSGVVTGSPRVFLLGVYFIIVFSNFVSAAYNLEYITISSYNPSVSTTPANIATGFAPNPNLNWDGAVSGNRLFLAYNTTSGGQSIKVTYLTAPIASAGGGPVTPITYAGQAADILGVCVDATVTNPVVWVFWYNSGAPNTRVLAVDTSLNSVLGVTTTQALGGLIIENITGAAQNGVLTVYNEIQAFYYGGSSIPTDYIQKVTTTQTGTVGSPTVCIRSVGLSSKAFIVGGSEYFLSAYQSPYQPTYFLVNGSSTSSAPVIVAKIAYQNGGGYLSLGLPSVTVMGSTAWVSYLFKDLISSVNKGTNVTSGTQVAGVYSQTGVSSAAITFNPTTTVSADIGHDLHLSGGFLWMYDGYLPVEHNFFVYPDSIQAAATGGGGSMAAQVYYYQVIYSWTDNQGNVFRSAPSIPVKIDLTGTGDTEVTLSFPYLRLTYKTANKAKIEIYRWSTAQQNYYQVTSISSPTLNSTTSDYTTFVDDASDATILGNSLLYTTGGVVEDINAPATNVVTLFDDRLWLVDAEDQNLLWFSKQVIEATPVEMSDLFTIYVAPTIGSQGSTGPISALSAMDDKLIIFKQNAVYYINGVGPDNTGSNSQYSQPIFITSTVGCANPRSIVFIPDGLMFQSDKGIWLLGRDLSTKYIGDAVEEFNGSLVESSLNIPGTNQVRFTLDTGQTLMFDYYYQQWGTFTGIPAVSSTLFQGKHTFINKYGQVFQEGSGTYLDGDRPVLIGLTTAWLNFAGLQGYQRAYFFYLLGQYLSPFKLVCSIAYDYVPTPVQVTTIMPTNWNPTYGGAESNGQLTTYGSDDPYGGNSSLFNWRVFLAKQRCSAVQITLQEVYDGSYGSTAGAGFTMSGINLIYAAKKGFRPQPAVHSTGSP